MASDFQESKRGALAALREVAEIAEQSGARSLSHKLRADRIPRLEDERFHLVVLGEFNHGKTTFVNALLGRDVLPTSVTPTTALIHKIEYGAEPGATVVSKDGTRTDFAIDRIGDYVVGGAGVVDDVQHVEVRYPSALLESGVVLVDTPGVNDLNEARAEITYGYIPRSDAVLFLLDAGQILKESEREFVSGKLLGGSRNKVIFIVNKVDLLTDQEREEALAYARLNLGKLLDQPRVYSVSAEKAVEGDREASGLDPFVTDLRAFLSDERGRVLLDNALEEGLRTASMLRTGVEIQRRALAMESDEIDARLKKLEADLEASGDKLAARKQKIREDISGVKALVRTDVENFGKRFALALPQEIEASNAKDLRRYLAGFIEERFRQFAEEQAGVVSKRLERVAEDAIAFVSDEANARAEQLEQVLGPAAPKLDLKVNTFAYNAGVFALGAFGVGIMVLSNIFVGGALTLAAPVLAYFLRGRTDKQVKERALEDAPKVVEEVATKMADEFDARIDEFGDKLIEFVAQANDEMTRSIAEVVRAARAAKGEGAEAQAKLESRVGMAVARLGGVEQRMETLRKSLWTNGKGQGPGEASA